MNFMSIALSISTYTWRFCMLAFKLNATWKNTPNTKPQKPWDKNNVMINNASFPEFSSVSHFLSSWTSRFLCLMEEKIPPNQEKTNQSKALLTIGKTRFLRKDFLQMPVVSQKCPFWCNWRQPASSKVNSQKMYTHTENKYKSESHILKETNIW